MLSRRSQPHCASIRLETRLVPRPRIRSTSAELYLARVHECESRPSSVAWSLESENLRSRRPIVLAKALLTVFADSWPSEEPHS